LPLIVVQLLEILIISIIVVKLGFSNNTHDIAK